MTEDKVVFDADEFTATEATVNPDWVAGYKAAMNIAAVSNDHLISKAMALVEAVYRDNSTNGDITSRETVAAADALWMELDRWK